ncbi:lecithin retinol acyltransferase family protein [Paraburkholderia phytofirmans]|uniref:lecithin retinol acyltransferase family protein n=1 Tax=Paraburkholderia phytofirmans TaxID=261302 RepID=UPI0038BB8F25
MSHPDHVQDANVASEPDLPRGAHLATRRTGYIHHGIYIGDGKVIHYSGFSRRFSRGPVEIVSIDQFVAGFGFEVVSHPFAKYTGLDVVRRAASRLGERNYRLLTNNCEHFCLWCLFGQGRSEQVHACIRNPAHGMVVIVTLVACVLSSQSHFASPVSPQLKLGCL